MKELFGLCLAIVCLPFEEKRVKGKYFVYRSCNIQTSSKDSIFAL